MYLTEPATFEFNGETYLSLPSSIHSQWFVEDLYYRKEDDSEQFGHENCYFLLPVDVYAKQLMKVSVFLQRFDQQKQKDYGPRPLLSAHGHNTGFLLMHVRFQRSRSSIKKAMNSPSSEVLDENADIPEKAKESVDDDDDEKPLEAIAAASAKTETKKKRKKNKKAKTSPAPPPLLVSSSVDLPKSAKQFANWKFAMICQNNAVLESSSGGNEAMFRYQDYFARINRECIELLQLPKKTRDESSFRELLQEVDAFCRLCQVEPVTELLRRALS